MIRSKIRFHDRLTGVTKRGFWEDSVESKARTNRTLGARRCSGGVHLVRSAPPINEFAFLRESVL